MIQILKKKSLGIIIMLLFTIIIPYSIEASSSLAIEYETVNDLSVILMIGDGMGYEQVKLGRWVEKGLTSNFTMENALLNLNVSTVNIHRETTDSAAAATAMATGVKVSNKYLSIAENGTILQTILEIAQDMGKATGIVTTTYVQHATPAGFMTHVHSRSMYDEISRQIIEEANVDVLLGGGNSYFSTGQVQSMEAKNYTLVTNKTHFQTLTEGKIFGVFADGHLPYEQDRNFTLTPSLSEMTEKALEILAQNDSGFFLMVEGGRIDHGGHANNQVNVALEMIAFAKAVEKAIAYVKNHDNTILIVTADHETGGLVVKSEALDNNLPIFGYTEEQNRTIQIARANQINVEWSTTGHTSAHVPFFGFGKAFTKLLNNILIDNTAIFHIMNDYFAGKLLEITSTTVETNNYNLYLIPIAFLVIFSRIFRKKRIKTY